MSIYTITRSKTITPWWELIDDLDLVCLTTFPAIILTLVGFYKIAAVFMSYLLLVMFIRAPLLIGGLIIVASIIGALHLDAEADKERKAEVVLGAVNR